MMERVRAAKETSRGSIWVKICGLTNLGDAIDAVEAGADALGFNFCQRSPRYLDPKGSLEWLGEIPSKVMRVAVMVDPTEAEAVRMAELPFIDCLQLHGSESPALCRALKQRGIALAKAFAADNRADRNRARDYSTRTLVLDSAAGKTLGGTGRTFDWSLARGWIGELPDFQIILAGGLTPENVGKAVEEVKPFGVDVTTGVEISAGRKDPARVRAFIAAARAALA